MQTEDLLPPWLLSYEVDELKKKNLTQILHIRLISNGTESRDPCGSASVKIPHSAPGQVAVAAPPAVMQQNAKQQQLQVQRSCSTSGRQRGGGSRSVKQQW